MKIKTATLIQLALAYEGVFAHGQDKNDSEHGGLEHQVRGRSLSNEASACKTYLALGDSIPAGTKDRDQIQSTVTTPFKDNSYPQFLYNRLLDKDIGFHSFVNLACPLETSAEMLNGDLETELSPTGSACYGETSPMAELSPSISALVAKQGGGILKSQLEAAKIVLATQDVGLVTVTVGGNDVLESCPPREIPQDELPACISKQLSLVAANLYTILGTIQGIAPGVPIMVSNYYNPFLAFNLEGAPPELSALAESTQGAVVVLNSAITHVVESVLPYLSNVALVDLESAFDTMNFAGSPSRNTLEICKNTFMCREDANGDYTVRLVPNPDIHPNFRGHHKIARAFAKALEEIMA